MVGVEGRAIALQVEGQPETGPRRNGSCDQIHNSTRYEGCNAKIQLVVDGAYATRDLLTAMSQLNVTALSELRSNACLYDLPTPPVAGMRGRPRKYGVNQINRHESRRTAR